MVGSTGVVADTKHVLVVREPLDGPGGVCGVAGGGVMADNGSFAESYGGCRRRLVGELSVVLAPVPATRSGDTRLGVNVGHSISISEVRDRPCERSRFQP